MHFSIQRQYFLKLLRAAAVVVERHRGASLHSIVGQILIRIKGLQQLSLVAIDQDIELITCTQLIETTDSNTEVVLPFRKLFDICSALPEEQRLSFATEGARFVMCAGRSRFILSMVAANTFPVLPVSIDGLRFSISKGLLRSLLVQTDYAMAEKDVRSYLNGLLWEIKGNKFYSIGADGHRLAFAFVEIEIVLNQSVRVIVPRKAIIALQRILLVRSEDPNSEERIEMIIGPRHIRWKTNETQLTTGLLDTHFPDVWHIMQTTGEQVLTVNRDAFKEALQRAAALLGDRSKGVSLMLSNGLLKILAVSGEQDEIEEELVIDYEGPSFTMAFNIKYLLDFLSVLTHEQFFMRVTGPNNSAQLKGAGETNGTYVIMPMTL